MNVRLLLPVVIAAGLIAPVAAQTTNSPPNGSANGGSMGGAAGGNGAEATVTLKPENNSNEGGMAKLTQTANGLVVQLTLTAPPSSPEPAVIARGTCSKPGSQQAYQLQNITAGQDQQGKAIGVSSTTLHNVTLNQLTSGQYAIDVHKSGTASGNPVSCGDISNANPTGTSQ